MRTLYDVLAVPPSASPDDIRFAYRRLARIVHPDRHQGSALGETDALRQAMAELNEAWQVLSDPRRRQAYDQTLGTETPAHGSGVVVVTPSAYASPPEAGVGTPSGAAGPRSANATGAAGAPSGGAGPWNASGGAGPRNASGRVGPRAVRWAASSATEHPRRLLALLTVAAVLGLALTAARPFGGGTGDPASHRRDVPVPPQTTSTSTTRPAPTTAPSTTTSASPDGQPGRTPAAAPAASPGPSTTTTTATTLLPPLPGPLAAPPPVTVCPTLPAGLPAPGC